jgi:RNA polymerase sigma-70 factor (ECF subfamily)
VTSIDEHRERELIEKFLEGEPWPFDELMSAHQEGIYRLSQGMLGDPDLAADITQETFLRAFRSLSTFRFQSRFGTWLHRIAVNLCLGQLRQAKLRRMVSLEGMTERLRSSLGRPARDLADRGRAERIDAAIASLPPRQRAVFLMRQDQGLPHTEIAKILQRSEGAIRASYHQAVRKLRAALTELPDEDE